MIKITGYLEIVDQKDLDARIKYPHFRNSWLVCFYCGKLARFGDRVRFIIPSREDGWHAFISNHFVCEVCNDEDSVLMVLANKKVKLAYEKFSYFIDSERYNDYVRYCEGKD